MRILETGGRAPDWREAAAHKQKVVGPAGLLLSLRFQILI